MECFHSAQPTFLIIQVLKDGMNSQRDPLKLARCVGHLQLPNARLKLIRTKVDTPRVLPETTDGATT